MWLALSKTRIKAGTHIISHISQVSLQTWFTTTHGIKNINNKMSMDLKNGWIFL